ncbi:hypothetical protein [Streptomyces sp. MUM 178J]|uniref:hypothetical protein n=1 Tax=Streptomyces sp. MUM 178J TaxID=2791991 RepID=UPI001F04208F|nr:hypothetical protein [Streptomyces sp. MUM 178J]WRQ79356.1 hypothetical protein I3F59_008255 [Streptomyces sp. MUM 178J]
MTIRSRGDDADPSVVFASARRFRVWRYGVGHSQLLLRSAPDPSNPERLDLLFEGVEAIQLVTHYEALELHTLDEAENGHIFEMSGVPAHLRPERLVLGLRSRSGAGYVQCLKVSALLGGRNVIGPDDPSESIDVIWSLRS